MLIHHLTVLGALATLAAATIEEGTYPPSVLAGQGNRPLYDDGCPCYHQEDVDAFVRFAKRSDDCSVSKYNDASSGYISLSMSASVVPEVDLIKSRYFSIDISSAIDGSCSSSESTTDSGSGPSDLDGYTDKYKNSYAHMTETFAEEISECQALMEEATSKLTTMGCSIWVGPCTIPCVNGNCNADKCECYPGWMGDTCEDCDESYCVNGSCTEYGCQCNPNWQYPDCSVCVAGWTGPNCDQCDQTLCVNGNCTESGCICNPGWDQWVSPPCSSCLLGWTGEKCDVCSCGRGGVCSEYGGCDCKPNWQYPECNTCNVGWTGENCDQCDDAACVNGTCTESGCQCNPGWNQWSDPPCSSCIWGRKGENCDECDQNACNHGVCSGSECICEDKWTDMNCESCPYPWTVVDGKCNTCDVGWAGVNCDTCDPGLCSEGFCNSCMNGMCTGDVCDCDGGWFGENCNRAYDIGCPCFDVEDVETFLNFAKKTLVTGYCEFYTDGERSYLSAYSYSDHFYMSLVVSDTTCSSFRTDGTSVTINEEESAACLDVFVDAEASEKMTALGCSNYT